MSTLKLTDIERQVMEAFWTQGALCIREVQETFPAAIRPAYTTVQTVVYRLENKKALRRAKKISNAHIFEAVLSRDMTQRRLIDEVLGLSGGRSQPVMSYLIRNGKITLEEIRAAEKDLRELLAKRVRK